MKAASPELLRNDHRQVHASTITRILVWAGNAASAHPQAQTHQRISLALEDDRHAKTRKIKQLEREIVGLLVETPYLLLLWDPGINVVSAAKLAGEMGPISNYASAKCITQRAGLFPSRSQSNETDRPDGKIVRSANRSLRAVLMMIADNLLKCNAHFRASAAVWKAEGKDPRHRRVRIASRFTRIVFQMAAGGQLFQHPSRPQRGYVLDKLIEFHHERETAADQILRDLQRACGQIPASQHVSEAAPLQRRLQKAQRWRRKGPVPISKIMLSVLAKLGGGVTIRCVRGSGPRLTAIGPWR